MVLDSLTGQDLLVGDRLLNTGGVHQRILNTVALGDNGDDTQDITVLMVTGRRLDTNGVLNRLVTLYEVRGNIHETDRLGSGNDRRHMLVDGQLLHLLIGLLRPGGEREDGKQHRSRRPHHPWGKSDVSHIYKFLLGLSA